MREILESMRRQIYDVNEACENFRPAANPWQPCQNSDVPFFANTFTLTCMRILHGVMY